MRSLLRSWQWKLARAADQRRLASLQRMHPGLRIDPSASSNLARSQFDLWPGATVEIGARVATERRVGGVTFSVREGGVLRIGDGTWLRSDLGPVHLHVFAGGVLEIGPDAFLNGCHLSAKERVTLGKQAWVGPGTRVFDSDQHDLDLATPERSQPVIVGDHVWIASDVTVLRGVEIGSHSVVGARAVVTRSLPPHSLAHGAPATRRGEVGDRTDIPI